MEKYQNNKIDEKDFNNDNKKIFIRQYFKILFNDAHNLILSKQKIF